MSTGTPAMVPLVTLKYLSDVTSASATCCMSSPDVGPCTASAATVSDTSSISTSSPAAFCTNQRRLGSAAVQRYRCSPNRVTVPSSISTSSPAAFCTTQRRLGSAAVQRYRCSPNRVTVPSSITLPCSSHQGV